MSTEINVVNQPTKTVLTCRFGQVVFGKKALELSRINEEYSNIEFLKLKQIHSAKVVEGNHDVVEADGHYSFQPRTACLIQTADCMPIVFIGKNVCFGVHAGWRGMEQNIIRETALIISELNLNPSDFFVFIGPHIQRDSFEVSIDVAERLLLAVPKELRIADHLFLDHKDSGKKFVDLDYLARSQLEYEGFDEQKLWISKDDTTKDPAYHSYRRDKTPGRQWSFGFTN